MKDRTNPCIYYVCAHGTCQKGRKDVTVKKMQKLCEIPRTEKPPPGGTR